MRASLPPTDRPADTAHDTRCWRCGGATDRDDRYCRHCSEGQGDLLAWYYRPLWILVLGLTVLGPFVLPLVWRTPRLDRRGKWIVSAIVILVFGYTMWKMTVAVRDVSRILDGL